MYRAAGTEKGLYQTVCVICLISGFRREITENCALPGFYAASNGNFLPRFRDNLPLPSEERSSRILCKFVHYSISIVSSGLPVRRATLFLKPALVMPKQEVI